MSVKLMFYITKTSPFPNIIWDEIIACATWGPYCHCQLMFSDGKCFGSLPFNGVCYTDDTLDPTHWVWFELSVNEQEEVGEKWFCSEICIAGLNENTKLKFVPCLSPNGLYYACYSLAQEGIIKAS